MFRIIHMNIQTLIFWKKTDSEEGSAGIFKNPPHDHKRGRMDMSCRLQLNQIRQSYHPNIISCYSNSARNLIRRAPAQKKESFSMDSIVESLRRVLFITH
ncbi:MAG: hypothetical protein FWE93_06915 [Alphaproteobacteria bacterium]|nr:hypothetical protein [Alphaproteobacteria bacterium]